MTSTKQGVRRRPVNQASSSKAGAPEPPQSVSRDVDRDAGAWTKRTLQQINRAVRRLCPKWLTDYREDFAQDAFRRVLEVKKRNQGRELSNSYLQKAAFTAIIDEIRRHKRRNEVRFPGGADSCRDEDGFGNPEDDPERRANQNEIGEGIIDCLQRIKKERRMALVLYLQGYSVAESAAILGWSPKKVENLVSRGKKDLRACLQKKEIQP